MAKFRGLPTYTQNSVAFPTVALHTRGAVDDINISFDAEGGGTYGEFTVEWIDLKSAGRKEEPPALRLKLFTDGMGAFYDERVQRVFDRIRRLPQARRDVSPERLIEMLEEEGIGPSLHHLRGMVEHGDLPHEQRVEVERKLAKMRKREGE